MCSTAGPLLVAMVLTADAILFSQPGLGE